MIPTFHVQSDGTSMHGGHEGSCFFLAIHVSTVPDHSQDTERHYSDKEVGAV